MLKHLDLMLLSEHLAVLRTGDRDAIEQRMVEMATALDAAQATEPGLPATERLVRSYLGFLRSAEVDELSPEVHMWMLELMANEPGWVKSDNRARDGAALARLFATCDDPSVRVMSVTTVVAGDQIVLRESNIDNAELIYIPELINIPALWGSLREFLEDRGLISARLLELTETFIDLWIVPESHELAARCLRDLFGYSRRSEAIPIDRIQSLAAERASEIGGQLGEELERLSRSI